MSATNKATLLAANAAIIAGDNEGFLSHCTEDTVWNFVGDQVLRGKQAVREWMAAAYKTPPKFEVEQLIADGAFVIAMGSIIAADETGNDVPHAYCDVWEFRDGKMCGLRAFVIADKR